MMIHPALSLLFFLHNWHVTIFAFTHKHPIHRMIFWFSNSDGYTIYMVDSINNPNMQWLLYEIRLGILFETHRRNDTMVENKRIAHSHTHTRASTFKWIGFINILVAMLDPFIHTFILKILWKIWPRKRAISVCDQFCKLYSASYFPDWVRRIKK